MADDKRYRDMNLNIFYAEEIHEEAMVDSKPKIVPSVAFETNCTRCGELLPLYMRALGICGDCLTESQREVRSIPGPRYRGE